ncbi:MAG TPA: ATP-binding protein [Marmoricola sp.]|nr:ATP-binding protein [Marmoricola sp.]
MLIGALAVRGATGPLALSVQAPGIALFALHLHRTNGWRGRTFWSLIIWLTLLISFSLTQRQPATSVLLATATSAGCILGYVVLTRGLRIAPALKTRDDLTLFGYAYLVCLTVTMTCAFAGAMVIDAGHPWVAALATCSLTALSFGLSTPMFCETLPHQRNPWVAEHIIHWAAITALTTLLFSTPKGESLVYLLIPLVGYAALRFSLKEAVAQLWVVAGIAVICSYGLIPGSQAVPMTFSIPLPHDLHLFPLSTLTTVCLAIVLVGNVTDELLVNLRGELNIKTAQLAETLKIATGTAILETDLAGNLVFFSRGAELITGYSAREVMGRSPSMFFSPESLIDIATRTGVGELPSGPGVTHTDRYNYIGYTLGKRAITKAAKGHDWMFNHKDGRARWASTFISPKLDEHGRLIGFVGTCEDVTRRVATARSLNEALSKEREAVLRLAEVDKAKDQFVSTVSHELRTPITNIIGYTELLEDGELGELDEPQRQAVSRISFSGRRLLSLVNDLLTLSRVQQKGLEKNTATINLNKVLTTSVELSKPAGVDALHPPINLELPLEPVYIQGDGEKLERAVINLISNALKFTPPEGTVEVGLQRDPDQVRIIVSDTGRGLSPAEQEKLFTRFFRAESAERDAIPGSGLGLSIVKTIVELHEGTISVDSESGSGSTFTISLPLS